MSLSLDSPRFRKLAYLCIVAFAAFLRLWRIGEVPPGLWYDEALYCLNALSIGHGHWPIFFMLHDHPVEPLYVYTLAGAFSLFGASVLTARILSALWGTAAVALFYPLARRFVGERWALVGCFVYAVFRWPLHFSRTIFRAITPPVFLMLFILFFLRWRRTRHWSDAYIAGGVLGLGFYTYISFRLVPILWLMWLAWLWWRGEIVWRRDGKAIAAMAGVALLVFAPLGVDFLRHPNHFFGRVDEVTMFHDRVEVKGTDGQLQTQLVRKPLASVIAGLSKNALDVARMWTFKGDHVGRHNLPYEPVFDWISGLIFYLGLAYSVRFAHRLENAFLPLAWVVTLSAASVFSFGAPNILRMQGAIPAVVLLYVRGLMLVYDRLRAWGRRRFAQVCVAALTLWFAGYQLDSYFRRFATSLEVRNEFLTDTFYAPAVAVRQLSTDGTVIWVSKDLAEHLTFKFVTNGVRNIVPIERLDEPLTTTTRPARLLYSAMFKSEEEKRGVVVEEKLEKAQAHLEREFRVTIPQSSGAPPLQAPFAYLWTLPAAHPTTEDATR
jgi:4-amino-4-deoxy-L-arabinose transferase-like glycosyltransferase